MKGDQDFNSKFFFLFWKARLFFNSTDDQEKEADKNSWYYTLTVVDTHRQFVIGPIFLKTECFYTKFPCAHKKCVSASDFS